MDCNKFSFDALFSTEQFIVYESEALLSAYKELNDVIEQYIADDIIRSKVESAALSCSMEARCCSFEQGFCFAVKLLKKINEITVSER
ncbi:MAG: hypothetical protein NC395_10855 [Prevotella sp.]|nr:hypothetical protein [Prevotella sp.]